MFGRSKLYVRLIVMSLVTTVVLIKKMSQLVFSFSVDFGSYLDQSRATFGGCTLYANYEERGPNTSLTRSLWSVGPGIRNLCCEKGMGPPVHVYGFGSFFSGTDYDLMKWNGRILMHVVM